MAEPLFELPDRHAALEFYAKYEPKEVLGHGFSSVVRRCVAKECPQLEFAVKIMDVSAIGGGDGVEDASYSYQIEREVNILRLVSGHDNIVKLIDVFESSTYFFLVFELCSDGELFDYLTAKVTLPEKSVRFIMKQLLEAVAHCHRFRIVHRDLKPENILLEKGLVVKLTDFGLSKVLAENERLYQVCGTPAYLAPEVLRAGMMEKSETNGYGIEIDLWACGVIMFTLLAGCPPFWHRKQLTMIRSIMEGRYSFASPEWQNVTNETKDLISRLLQVDYKLRLNVDQALGHSVFVSMKSELPKFNAAKTFRKLIICVRFLIKFRRGLSKRKNQQQEEMLISFKRARLNPYAMRSLRKAMDHHAFKIYAHWIKRGQAQDRAALFEYFPKIEGPPPPLTLLTA